MPADRIRVIERLARPVADADIRSLAELLVDTVDSGAAVSFVAPLTVERSERWWRDMLAASDPRAIILVARDRHGIVGSVQMHPAWAPNQPHRAEIAKMMTRLSHRGRGVATALMRTAEELAMRRNRTLLVLDTASDGGAAGLYEKLGFTLAGEIPDYALKPHGGLSGTLIYWKRIGA